MRPAARPVGPTVAAGDAGLAWFRAELNERLVVHWTGGAWRVPLGTRHLAVAAADGSALGRIVCADAADGARALAGLSPVASAPLTLDAADRALAPFAPLLAALRALEGAEGDRWNPEAAWIITQDKAHLAAPSSAAPGQSPRILYSAADRPVAELVGLLIAGATQGVIWKPAPGASASAHLVMRALGPVAGRALALVQGDHASGSALAGLGATVWAGRGSPPPGLS
jgi:hypothetical protein